MAVHVSSFTFRCGLRGYHVYRNTWIPNKDEILLVKHEEENPFDRYAIAAVKRDRNPGAQAEKSLDIYPKKYLDLSGFLYYMEHEFH